MTQAHFKEAARQLAAARASGRLLRELDDAFRPATLEDAHAIQDATVAELGDSVAGWKVAAPMQDKLVRGVLLKSRVLESPTWVPAALVPLMGVEAEIAFRFKRDMPAQDTDYSYAEVAANVAAAAGIEIVDSRFEDYQGAPMLDKTADFVSNGAFILGSQHEQWSGFDLAGLEVTLSIDAQVVVRKVGGHPTGDPLTRAVQLVNAFRTTTGVKAGQVVTTGTYTGLHYAKAGQTVVATFTGFGTAQVSFI
jgi:2-keto-4-pentenoate hydratase